MKFGQMILPGDHTYYTITLKFTSLTCNYYLLYGLIFDHIDTSSVLPRLITRCTSWWITRSVSCSPSNRVIHQKMPLIMTSQNRGHMTWHVPCSCDISQDGAWHDYLGSKWKANINLNILKNLKGFDSILIHPNLEMVWSATPPGLSIFKPTNYLIN